jgi:hypothetical protein
MARGGVEVKRYTALSARYTRSLETHLAHAPRGRYFLGITEVYLG